MSDELRGGSGNLGVVVHHVPVSILAEIISFVEREPWWTEVNLSAFRDSKWLGRGLKQMQERFDGVYW